MVPEQHYPATPFPGELGNAAIAWHRTTLSQPFARTDELDEGDEIVVVTPARTFVYAVDSTMIVEPTDGQVVQTRDENEAASRSRRVTPDGARASGSSRHGWHRRTNGHGCWHCW
ncbi:MAG: class E sortase [Actinomycetota bacterium]|nr:class E sortase [Actinomycetota bacterium]